jgi:hypothetical protein
MGCNVDTGGARSDFFDVRPLHDFTAFDGVYGFKEQLAKAVDGHVRHDDAYLEMYRSFDCVYKTGTNEHAIDVGSGGYLEQKGDVIHQCSIFVPMGSTQLYLQFRTPVNCSVMASYKFVDIYDETHVWDITPFNSHTEAEDVIDPGEVWMLDDTNWQTKVFDAGALNGREGYFIIQWAEASHVIASATQNEQPYQLEIVSKLKIPKVDAEMWLNTSRSYLQPTSTGKNPYMLPLVENNPRFESLGTTCGQTVVKSGAEWLYPCDVVNIRKDDTYSSQTTTRVRFKHDFRFTTSWNVVVTNVASGTSIPSSDWSLTQEANHENYVDIVNLTDDTDYRFDFYREMNDGTYSNDITDSFFFTTVEVFTAVVPEITIRSQEESYPDRLCVNFDENEGVDNYDLYVNGVFETSITTTGTV